MLKTTFTPEWESWIKTNVDAGHDKDGLFKILHDEGFDYWPIVNALNHVPSKPMDQLINPLKAAEERKQAKTAKSPKTLIDLTANTTKTLAKDHGLPIKKSQVYIANADHFKSDKIDLRTVDTVLNEQECQELTRRILSGTPDMGDLAKDIDKRLCKLIGIDPAYCEPMRGQAFAGGQPRGGQTDYDAIAGTKLVSSDLGARSFTLMIYLNSVDAGGELCFKRLGSKQAGHVIAPAAGRAVIWNTLTPDGRPNKNAQCHIKAVEAQPMAVLIKSFGSTCKNAAHVPFFTKEINEYVPNYTRDGIGKLRLSDKLFEKVQAFYHDNRKEIKDEHVAGGFIYDGGTQKTKRKTSSSLVELTMELKADIHSEIKPLIEKWSGQTLDPALIYGVREYHEGAVLKMHRDRIETHVFGVIVNVDQDADEDWPFMIEDNYGRLQHVYFKPGDVLFYESCRLSHGRPTVFEGRAYANLFCHFKPVDYEPPVLA